jgi:hypothetical protein
LGGWIATRLLNYRELRRRVELNGVRKTGRQLRESLGKKELSTDDFSIREMAEAFMGREWVQSLHPKSGRRPALREASGDAVAFGQLSNITGQIVFSAIKESYDYEEFVFSQVIPTRPTNLLDIEKIPGISGVGDEFDVVQEAAEYPMVGVSEDWIEVAAKRKRGGIIAVTKEAIFTDKTGQLLDRARKLGWWLGLNREKRLIDCLIDENTGAASITAGGHRYHWKGTSYGTYQSSSPWANVVTGNALANWVNIDSAWKKLAAMTDPYTGEPILVQPTTIIVTPDLFHTARYVTSATEVRNQTNLAAGNTNRETLSPSPIENYRILMSRLLKARAATDTDWWFGCPEKAFAYFSAWDLVTEEAPANSREAFMRDITFQFKASEAGAAATLEPRLMTENQA